MRVVDLGLAGVLRGLVAVASYVVLVVVLRQSDGDGGGLGVGLLFFLGVVVVSLGWAGRDGARRGLLAALAVWLVAAATTGTGIPVAAVALDASAGTLAAEVREGFGFFCVLVAVPALVGAAIGGASRRVSSAGRHPG